MSETQKIKAAIQRTQKALTLKPALGKGTGVSKVRITNGLTCEIQEGNWKMNADMPVGVGGDGCAPTPGVYGRAALGSCLAIGYMMKAAELEIPITKLEVEVEADFDDGALLGTADKNIPPGYLEIRYTINIESDATKEKIMQLVDDGDAHSPYLDIFTRAQKCIRKVNINSTKTSN
ncbi:MAG: OsmC family protein [Ginsengibacter sp.]